LKIKKLQKKQKEKEKILNNISKIVVWLDVLKEISSKHIGKIDKLQFEEKKKNCKYINWKNFSKKNNYW